MDGCVRYSFLGVIRNGTRVASGDRKYENMASETPTQESERMSSTETMPPGCRLQAASLVSRRAAS
ncbi:hypothetical protein CHLRE_44g760747v5 [Chlamydomonas reinhardtii]|uniref:Uncharacterized protein n=1 Tax=Chlamydomonas reinhardtii TaxID=3055 RepID=A0A2K3CMT4_CHLRE|nr:uncharacterized protein CHLRE_44g760747v5 [Chlamydomonas reinhardtii]PNW69591.1 hypothetical protein CHLRE_44g760747v5 [Chlamydomonas reinhardtii]